MKNGAVTGESFGATLMPPFALYESVRFGEGDGARFGGIELPRDAHHFALEPRVPLGPLPAGLRLEGRFAIADGLVHTALGLSKGALDRPHPG